MGTKKKEMQEELNEETTNDYEFQSIDDAKSYISKLNEDLDSQKQRAEEYFDSLKRNMADFDNFKKRITKEKDSLYSSILSEVIQNILPIVDNFDKAISAECKDEDYKKGMEMIYKSILDLLKKYNVEEIPSLGETFDPEYHEAVMSVEDDTKAEKEVVEVFRKGYKMGDKVIRHTLVKVAN